MGLACLNCAIFDDCLIKAEKLRIVQSLRINFGQADKPLIWLNSTLRSEKTPTRVVLSNRRNATKMFILWVLAFQTKSMPRSAGDTSSSSSSLSATSRASKRL